MLGPRLPGAARGGVAGDLGACFAATRFAPPGTPAFVTRGTGRLTRGWARHLAWSPS